MRGKLIIIIFIGFCSSVFGQLELNKNYGFNVGFIGAFGTHVQRFGVVVQG